MTQPSLSLTLIDGDTDQPIESYHHATLSERLQTANFTIGLYLPQKALSPLEEWDGYTLLSQHLMAFVAKQVPTTRVETIRKALGDMTPADFVEERHAPLHSSTTVNGVAMEEWTRTNSVVAPVDQADRDAIGALLAFLKRGIDEGSLLRNETFIAGQMQQMAEGEAEEVEEGVAHA